MANKQELLNELESLSDEQLSQLSNEEREELALLLEQPDDEPTESVDIDTDLTQKGFTLPEEEPTMFEKAGSFALGVAKGATLNNLDEMIAGTSAIVDKINDPSTSLGANYTKNLNSTRMALGEAEKASPLSSGIGETIGTVGTAFIPGSVGAKLAGATLKSAITVGTLRGIGSAKNLRMDQETAEEIAQEIGIEAAGLGIGKLASKGISSLRKLKSQGNILSEVEFGRKRANALLDTIGVQGKANFKKFQKNVLQSRGMDEAQFMDDMLTDLKISPDMNPLQIKQAMKLKQAELWENGVSPIFDEVDKLIPEGAVKTSELRDRILNDLGLSEQFIDKTNDQLNNIVKKVIPEVLTTTENNIAMKIGDVQTLLNRVKNTALNRQTKKLVDRSVRNVMEETVEKVLSPDAAKSFKTLKRKYGNIAESLDFITDADATYREAIRKFDEGTASLWTRISSLGDLAKPGSSGKTVDRFVGILKNKAPLDFGPSARLFKLNQMADTILQNPNKYDGLVQRTTQAAVRSVDEFVKTMGVFQSTINLDNEPINKDILDITEKNDDIINVLSDFNPQLGQELQRALNINDTETVSKIISNVERLPEAKRFFMDSAPGFTDENGVRRLVDEVDQSKARNIINSMQITNRQKTMASKIINSGVMPPLPQERMPFQKVQQTKPRINGRKTTDF